MPELAAAALAAAPPAAAASDAEAPAGHKFTELNFLYLGSQLTPRTLHLLTDGLMGMCKKQTNKLERHRIVVNKVDVTLRAVCCCPLVAAVPVTGHMT